MPKKHKKQKGAGVGVNGTVGTLVDNLFAVADQTITTVKNTGQLIESVMNISTDLNQPYSATEQNAPGSNLT